MAQTPGDAVDGPTCTRFRYSAGFSSFPSLARLRTAVYPFARTHLHASISYRLLLDLDLLQLFVKLVHAFEKILLRARPRDRRNDWRLVLFFLGA